MFSPAYLPIVGVLALVFGVMMGVTALVALIYGEDTATWYLTIGLVSFGVGGSLFWIRRSKDRVERELRAQDGFIVTVSCYVFLGVICAVPLWFATPGNLSFTDAAFEAYSGLTTTGATVLSGLDEMPKALLFYRQLLQWLGGMGIIVLAIAVLPMLRVGGMQLYRAEVPGTVTDDRLKPRITETAKTLWYIYLGLTVICALGYWLAGMSPFDAICVSFSTIAIGGFAPHDASFAYYDSVGVESVAIVFMVLAGMNFALHYKMIATGPMSLLWRPKLRRQRRHRAATRWQRIALFLPTAWVRPYSQNHEVRLYLLILALLFAAVALKGLTTTGTDMSWRDIAFQTVSYATTSGFTTTNIDAWPLLCPVLLILAACAGGCVGSTAGGIKIYRLLVISRQGVRELRRLLYPDGVFQIKLGSGVVPDRVVEAVWGFFAAYIALFALLFCVVLGVSDLDIKSTFSAVAGCLNNLGPGLGVVSDNYASLNIATKWALIGAMLLGRLEIFTLLVLLTPRYWRR